MNRKEQILLAVDNLMRVHDRWEEDDGAPNLPSEELEQAVEDCVALVCNGDLPDDCREIDTMVSRLAVEWDGYRTGLKISRDGTPAESLWGAYRAVVQARQGAAAPVARTYEAVAKLVKEKVPNLQIAKIYGSRQGPEAFGEATWRGPFFDDAGRVRHDLIEQETDKPGSVIRQGWVHPDEVARVDRETEEMRQRLTRLEEQSEQREFVPPEDPATIEELLREGQFPATIAKVKHVSLDEVMEAASRIGLEPNDPDSDALWKAVTEDTPEAEDEREPKPSDDAAVRGMIIECYEDPERDLSAGEVAQLVNERLGRTDVTPQKVGAIIREHKKSLQDSAA